MFLTMFLALNSFSPRMPSNSQLLANRSDYIELKNRVQKIDSKRDFSVDDFLEYVEWTAENNKIISDIEENYEEFIDFSGQNPTKNKLIKRFKIESDSEINVEKALSFTKTYLNKHKKNFDQLDKKEIQQILEQSKKKGD